MRDGSLQDLHGARHTALSSLPQRTGIVRSSPTGGFPSDPASYLDTTPATRERTNDMPYDLAPHVDHFPVTHWDRIDDCGRPPPARPASRRYRATSGLELVCRNGPIPGSRSAPRAIWASRFLLQQLHRFSDRIQDDRGEQAEQHGGNHHDAEAYGEWAGG